MIHPKLISDINIIVANIPNKSAYINDFLTLFVNLKNLEAEKDLLQ